MENENLDQEQQDIQSQDQGVQPQEGNAETVNQVNSSPSEGAGSAKEVLEVLGRKYDISNADGIRELAKDYDRLGRQYAPLTKQLAELEGLLNKNKEQPQPDFNDPETVEYLRKLGFVTRDEQLQKEEDKALEDTLQKLEKNYDGKDGRPRFDRREVLEFCVNRGLSNPEDGYNILNWNAIKEWHLRQAKAAPSTPPSFGGEGGPREPQPKKRVFGPVAEGQVSLRDAMLETLEQDTPTSTA